MAQGDERGKINFIRLPSEMQIRIATNLNPAGVSALMRASRQLARTLSFELDRQTLTYKLENEESVLHWAAKYQRMELAERLLDRGFPISTFYGFGRTPLFKAIEEGHVDMVQILVDRGDDISQHDNGKTTALLLAAERLNVVIVRILIKAGADATKKKNDNCCFYDPLFAAVGSHVSRADSDPQTLEEIVRLLLDGGADPSVKDGHGVSVLHFAVRSRLANVALVLLESGSTFNHQDEAEQDMILAISQASGRLVQLILPFGADLGRAMLSAVCEGEMHILQSLARNDPTMLHRQEVKDQLLFGAVRSNQVEMVEYLLSSGADHSVRWEPERSTFCVVPDGLHTVLHFAAENGCISVARVLIQAGANIEAMNIQGETPLLHALLHGKHETARFLVNAGASGTHTDKEGISILHAVIQSHADDDLLTFLYDLPIRWDAAILDCILELGLDINGRDNRQETALHLAAREGAVDIVRCLVERGSDPTVNGVHDTPMEVAISNATEHRERYEPIFKILEEASHKWQS